MSHFRGSHVCLIAAILTFLGGCSGYHVSYLPHDGRLGNAEFESREFVAVGQVVRILLHSGDTIVGTVTAVTAEAVSVGKTGNYGFEVSDFLATDIDQIEVESNSLTATIGAGILGAAAVGVLYAITRPEDLEPLADVAK